MIGQAIRRLRDEEIQNNSQLDGYSLFGSRENVEARVKQILSTSSLNMHQLTFLDILGIQPENDLHDLLIGNLPGDTLREKDENMKALANVGKNADDYHKKISALSIAFKRAPVDKPLNADQLAAIAKEGTKIESRLLLSKARLFPLARLHLDAEEEKQALDTIPIPRFIFK